MIRPTTRSCLVAACVLMAAPAMAQSAGDRTGVNTALEKSGVNAAIGVAPATADFVTAAAQSDMFEIQSSRLAEQKATGATKAFAAQMIADHQKTTTELTSLLQSEKLGVTPPTDMSSAQQAKLADLQKLSGHAFEVQYAKDQVSAHRDAVSLFQRYAKGGSDAGMKAWAAKTLPTLEHHLQMAHELRT